MVGKDVEGVLTGTSPMPVKAYSSQGSGGMPGVT